MLTVLLVDDDAEFTEVACTIIEFLGHEVLTAANLEEARDSEDWDMVDECIESIRALIDDFDEYNSEEDWG